MKFPSCPRTIDVGLTPFRMKENEIKNIILGAWAR